MRSGKALSICALAVACLGATNELYAQVPTDRTYLEFTSPARIPGATLAPGMYLFVIGRPVGDQAIIDVYSADGGRFIAACLAVESRLPRPARSTTLDFAGTAPATLRAWFHPANPFGYEFVYNQEEAREIFGAARAAVPYAPFTPANRDLVGAFPIRHLTPVPVIGVAALYEPFDDTLDLHEHLVAARRVAVRTAQSQPKFKGLLEVLERNVAQLQGAHRRNDPKAASEYRRLVDSMINNLMPNEVEIAAHRQARIPRDIVLALERIAAHVRAADDAASRPPRASR